MKCDATTAEELLAMLPSHEDQTWEWKGAALLTNTDKHELRKKLGKAASAFTNSGGGRLVIGINENRELEPCIRNQGKQTIEDYLATLLSESVDPPLTNFQIQVLPFGADATKAVILISIEAGSPRQDKGTMNYFHRVGGTTKAASAAFINQLHHSSVASRLEVVGFSIEITSATLFDPAVLQVLLRVKVRNTGRASANQWGLRLQTSAPCKGWMDASRRQMSDGMVIRYNGDALLPGEEVTCPVHLIGESPVDRNSLRPVYAFSKLLSNIGIYLTPVSDNSEGEAIHFGVIDGQFSKGEEVVPYSEAEHWMYSQLEKYGINAIAR